MRYTFEGGARMGEGLARAAGRKLLFPIRPSSDIETKCREFEISTVIAIAVLPIQIEQSGLDSIRMPSLGVSSSDEDELE